MAGEGTVNDQITDSYSQTIGAVLGNSPSGTKGMLDALMAETVGMAMYNAVTNQHNAQLVSNASVIAACARMLKAPVASPLPYKAAPPIIMSITPNPIPSSPTIQSIQIAGVGFEPGLKVTLYDGSGTVLGVLTEPTQITALTSKMFTLSTNLFKAEGSYSVQIQNPNTDTTVGGVSRQFGVTVVAIPPSISSVDPVNATTFQVTGQNFQSGMTLELNDSEEKPISGATVSGLTPTSFQLTLPAGAPNGPYSMKLTNPCGRSAKKLFMGPATTVHAAASLAPERRTERR